MNSDDARPKDRAMTAMLRRKRRRKAPTATSSSPPAVDASADAPSEISPAFETDIAPDLIDTFAPVDRTETVDAECHLVESPARDDTPD